MDWVVYRDIFRENRIVEVRRFATASEADAFCKEQNRAEDERFTAYGGTVDACYGWIAALYYEGFLAAMAED